jgi:branched-chain amino acid transport system substrate-binding protein
MMLEEAFGSRFGAARVSRISALVLACGIVLGAAGARAADPFNIDVVLPLTGPAAFLGSAEQVALQRAEAQMAGQKTIGGRPVHFVFHDDQSSPQVAVQLATQIAAGKPPVVLGSAVVAMCNAMAPLMRRGPVLYCLSPGVYPASGSFMFSSSNATRDLLAAQIRYFRSKGMLRLAIVTSTDASGQDAARNVKEILTLPENKDVQLVGETTFNPTDVSAAAQIQRLKGANPQALIAWSTGAAIGTVFKAVQDSGLDVPVATTDGNMTYASMQRYSDILPKELLIPSPEWPRSTKAAGPADVEAAKSQFFAAFTGDERPDAASSFAWDPAMLVVSALQKLGPGATAEQLRAALAGLSGFAGINGSYDFVQHPQRGLDDGNVVVTRWDKIAGTWTIVSGPRGVPF